ncbi:MAG: hypothetical protein PHR81_12750 [Bacteroidales bacterium]|jgi:hypothetical protein|nr:hypothetical protein [Bacteroidales bacterium]MDD4215672.1 hypothetical protein [Bacteroidales bacterium]
MNTTTIISLVIVIALTILLILFFRISKKKKIKKKLRVLQDYASQNNCNITQHEFCGDLLIGTDESSDFVFFLRFDDDKISQQHINLEEIADCRVLNTSRSVNSAVVIDKLELCFIAKEKTRPQIVWEFYNSDNNPALIGELQYIEKWAEIIKRKIKIKQNSKK